MLKQAFEVIIEEGYQNTYDNLHLSALDPLTVSELANLPQAFFEQDNLDGKLIRLKPKEVISAPPRVTYSQRWPEYNAAQATEKGSFLRLLHGLCQGIYKPPQTMGRPRLSFADMVFACAFKVYSGLSGRRFGSDLEDALERGYIAKVPHFNSIYNYLEKDGLTPLLHELITVTVLPLKTVETNFAVDSSGFGNSRFVR